MKQMSLLNQYDIDKERFVELFSKFTGISKTKLYDFLETNSISTLFEHPASINVSDTQRKKINQLKELRNVYNNLKSQDKVYKINSSQKAGEYFKEYFSGSKDKERFVCAFLDNGSRIIATKVISKGTVDGAPVFPREILKSVLLYDACSVILAHNHPGGSLHSSSQDITVTKTIGDALVAINIKVLDHIIVADDNFSSFAEKGLALSSHDNTPFREQLDFKENDKSCSMSERMTAAKEKAQQYSIHKQNNPKKDKNQNKEREER